jgi:predicted ester cyclase
VADENQALVRRIFEEAFVHGNLGAVDELVAPDVVDHSTMAAPAPGAEGFKQRIAGLRNAFPDCRFELDNLFGDGDRVAFTWTFTGTHTGNLGVVPPTGRQVTVTGVNVERVAGGRVVEHWSSPDNLGMFQQLGLVPPLGPPPPSG